MKLRRLFPILAIVALAGCGLFGGCAPHSTVTPAIVAPAPLIVTPVKFVDIAIKAGINFTHNNGAFGAKLLPETMGSGIGFIDYDNDGYQDLLIINCRDWTDAELQAYKNGTGKSMASQLPPTPPKKGGTCKLYHNNGNGTFTDATAGSGIDVPMFGMGIAVGDYDNDGKADIYITAVGRNYLFHNEGNGKFKDVSVEKGVKDSGWSTSAAWLDYDNDGKLDLFVCHYVQWTPGSDIYFTLDGKSKAYTTPEQYTSEYNTLYHNEGNGKFKDVSKQAGIQVKPAQNGIPAKKLQGKSLGVCICDYDNDGHPDIIVANDTEPNYLYRNNGNGTFTEIGTEVGIAFNEAGIARASMGVDAGNIDHSGRESLLFGNFSNQMLGLYKNKGSGLYIDIAPMSEVGSASLKYLAFGVVLADLDNDGWDDIFTANGHLDQEIDSIQRDVKYLERPLLFQNLGQGRFKETGLQSGDALAKPVVGRGAACADFDLDGCLDLVISTNGGPIELLHNESGNKNGSIRLVLEGTKSNRSAIGAVVEAKVGTETIRKMVRSGSSYCSASELPVTIGMAGQAKADVTIHWPSSEKTELKDVAANQILNIQEGKGIVKQQPFAHK